MRLFVKFSIFPSKHTNKNNVYNLHCVVISLLMSEYTAQYFLHLRTKLSVSFQVTAALHSCNFNQHYEQTMPKNRSSKAYFTRRQAVSRNHVRICQKYNNCICDHQMTLIDHKSRVRFMLQQIFTFLHVSSVS